MAIPPRRPAQPWHHVDLLQPGPARSGALGL